MLPYLDVIEIFLFLIDLHQEKFPIRQCYQWVRSLDINLLDEAPHVDHNFYIGNGRRLILLVIFLGTGELFILPTIGVVLIFFIFLGIIANAFMEFDTSVTI